MAEDTIKKDLDGVGLEARAYETLEKDFHEVSGARGPSRPAIAGQMRPVAVGHVHMRRA